MVAAVSGVGATAVQISLVPNWPLARRRRVHVTPPPVTVENVCAPGDSGPSEVMNATSSSFAAVVLKAGETIDVAAAVWFVLTTLSVVTVAAWLVAAPAQQNAMAMLRAAAPLAARPPNGARPTELITPRIYRPANRGVKADPTILILDSGHYGSTVAAECQRARSRKFSGADISGSTRPR